MRESAQGTRSVAAASIETIIQPPITVVWSGRPCATSVSGTGTLAPGAMEIEDGTSVSATEASPSSTRSRLSAIETWTVELPVLASVSTRETLTEAARARPNASDDGSATTDGRDRAGRIHGACALRLDRSRAVAVAADGRRRADEGAAHDPRRPGGMCLLHERHDARDLRRGHGRAGLGQVPAARAPRS